jgi:hypothetical protein
MAAFLTLASAKSTTGAGTPVDIGIGGDFCFAVNGTFGGTSAVLEMLGPDGTNYIGLGASATFTAAGLCIVSLPRGKYRVNNTGGTGISLFATLSEVS